MVTRIWHGKTKAKDSDAYLHYRSIPGNVSAGILRRIDDEVCHFYTITKWDNMESIIKFAGSNYEKARYYPEDEKYLLEFEESVIHCETFEY